VDKDDPQKPLAGQEKEPDTDSSETPDPSSPSPNSAETPKPIPRRSRFLFFPLILILAVSGTAYYYELKQQDFIQYVSKRFTKMDEKVTVLGKKSADRPHQNSKDLHFLTEKFEQSQVQVADATRRQTEAIEALRQEIDQLKARLDGSTETVPIEEVPPTQETPVAGDQDKTPVTGDPEENTTETVEPIVADQNEVGGEETPPGPVEEGPVEPDEEKPVQEITEEEPAPMAEEQVEPTEAGLNSAGEPESEVETEPADEMVEEANTPVHVDITVAVDPSVEVQTLPQETTPQPNVTAQTVTDTETLAPTPPQPEVEKETVQPEAPRSEGEQEYIDFVETTTGKFFRLVKEGSVKLWDYLASLL